MILVIDDEKEFTTLTAMILQRHGYAVVTANKLEDVVYHLNTAEEPIELILLDLMMPELTGVELFVRLRTHKKTSETPVIVLSAVNEVNKRVEMLELGVDDYLVKPCPIDELLTRIAVHIQLGQLKQAKKQADKRITSQTRFLKAINNIGNQATQYLDLKIMMEKVTQLVVNLLECGACTIYLRDAENEDESLQGVASTKQTIPPINSHLQAAVQYETTIIDGQDSYIPILRGDVLLGVLTISDSLDEQLLKDKVQTLETLCVQLGIAITNAYLFEDINHRNNQLALVAQENRHLYEEQAKLLHEQRLSQEQLIQSEKMAVAGRLAASMAHEINNPLQAIHSCLQLTTQFELSRDKQMEYLVMAEEEVERLMTITNRILDFSRPSSGTFEQIRIHRIINQVMHLASKHLAHQKISVKQIIDSDVSPVYVIPDQITQVFLHIIINAIDATPPKGELLIHTMQEDHWVKTQFQDFGTGMTSEVKSHVFEPFFTTKETQSGLGLSISYGIIQRHQGKIEIESNMGQGTTVTVYLRCS